MNFDKTDYNNSFTNFHKLNIFKRKKEVDNPFQKLVPTFNYQITPQKAKKILYSYEHQIYIFPTQV